MSKLDQDPNRPKCSLKNTAEPFSSDVSPESTTLPENIKIALKKIMICFATAFLAIVIGNELFAFNSDNIS
jgi:hypothetical protein